MTIKRKFSPEKKANIALAAIRGDNTIAQLSSVYQIHPTQLKRWKKTAEDNLSQAFTDKRKKENKDKDRLIDELYKIIGQRETELSWLKKKLSIFDD